MKQIVVIALMILCAPAVLYGQSDWDVTGDTPPPIGNTTPVKKPVLSIEPFRLLVFEGCEPDRNGQLSSTGKLGITVLSEYGAVGFYPHATDSSLTLKLKSRGQGETQEAFRIPQRSFTLFVILGNDTATFWVEKENGSLSVTYLKESELLLLEEVRDLHGDIIPMQMMPGSTQKSAKEFIEELKKAFGDDVHVEQLAPGFYPCLPVPFVEPTRIGRGSRALQLNKTSQGLLLCVQIDNTVRRQEIADWVYARQKKELERHRSERG